MGAYIYLCAIGMVANFTIQRELRRRRLEVDLWQYKTDRM
jgi:hypothetical protein